MTEQRKYINWIFGILFSAAMVFGYSAEHFGGVDFKDWKTYLFFIIIAVAASFLTGFIWNLMLKHGIRVKPAETVRPQKKLIAYYAGSIWLLNFVVFLGVYPGFFTYDAQYELLETVTRSFDTQHPMFHVLAMGGIVQLVHKLTDNYNLGIAAFIIAGMTVCSGIYGYFAYRVRCMGVGRKWTIALTLYLGAFPVLVMYSLCSAKDGLFGAFLLLAVILIKRLTENPEGFYKLPYLTFMLVFSLVMMMLLRNNGIYAFAVFMVIALPVFLRTPAFRSYTVRFALTGIFSVAAYFAINATLLFVVDAYDIGHREILTVPIQQLARVYAYDNKSLADDEKIRITKYIPQEALMRYNPKCSDMVKIEFNEGAFLKDKEGFFKIWAEVGLKSPAAYVNSVIMTSYGLWYPGAMIDGYKGNQMFTYVYNDSSYFGYEVEPPGIRHSLIPVIDKVYRFFSLDPAIQKIPVLRMLFSPGFMLWIMLFMQGFMIYAHKGRDAIGYLLPLLVLLTCVLGPISLVRYAFYLWLFVPMMLIEICMKRCYTNEL